MKKDFEGYDPDGYLTSEQSREKDAIKFMRKYAKLCKKYKMFINGPRDSLSAVQLAHFDPKTDIMVYRNEVNAGPLRENTHDYFYTTSPFYTILK